MRVFDRYTCGYHAFQKLAKDLEQALIREHAQEIAAETALTHRERECRRWHPLGQIEASLGLVQM